MVNRISQHLEEEGVYDDLVSVPDSPIVRVISFENILEPSCSIIGFLGPLRPATPSEQSIMEYIGVSS